jgi:hypothetical protein
MVESKLPSKGEGHELRRGVCVMIHAVRIPIRNHKPHLVLGQYY